MIPGTFSRHTSDSRPMGRGGLPLVSVLCALFLVAGPVYGAEESNSADETDAEAEPETSESPEEGAHLEDEEALFDVSEDGEIDEDGESEERDPRERRDDVPLRKMDRKEAEEAGFDFGGRERPTRRTTGALLAATGGLLAHGIGHWYVEDPRTAFTLAAMEGTSLALMGSGLAVWLTERDSVAGNAFGKTAFHLGAGLFGISYLIDVLGALQGARLRLPENSGHHRGLSVHAGYRYREVTAHPLRHFFVGRIDYDIGRVFGRVRTEQGFQLDVSEYEGEVGVRVIRGEREMTFGYVELLGGMFQYRGAGEFDRVRGEARMGASLDFGFIAPHLDQLAVGAEAGWGVASHRLPVAERPEGRWADLSAFLPAEVYTDMNLSDRLNVRVSYEKRSGDHLQATRALVGVGGIRFRYDSSDLFDLELAGRFGGGYAVHAGIGLQLWE